MLPSEPPVVFRLHTPGNAQREFSGVAFHVRLRAIEGGDCLSTVTLSSVQLAVLRPKREGVFGKHGLPWVVTEPPCTRRLTADACDGAAGVDLVAGSHFFKERCRAGLLYTS